MEKVLIKPQINYRMKKMEFSYNSVSGKYMIFWKWIKDRFYLDVIIPYGCEAEVILPNNKTFIAFYGEHHFECKLNKDIYSPFSVDTPLIDMIKNKKSRFIVKKFVPKIYSLLMKNNSEYTSFNIKYLNKMLELNYPSKVINECNEELSKINP